MKKIINLIVLISLLSLSIGCSSDDKLKELTKEEKVEDFDYYINTMKENYCNFDVFYNKFNIEYLDLYEDLKEEIENSDNNKEFYDIMNFSISLLKDGHTNLVNPSQVEWYKNGYNGEYQGDILNDKEVINKNKEWEKYLINNDNLDSINKSVGKKEPLQKKII